MRAAILLLPLTYLACLQSCDAFSVTTHSFTGIAKSGLVDSISPRASPLARPVTRARTVLSPRMNLRTMHNMARKSEDGLMHHESLQQFTDRIDLLQNRQVSFVKGFWNRGLSCFQHNPSASERLSMSSTSLAVLAIMQDSDLWTGVAGRMPSAEICLIDVRDALANTTWSMQPFDSFTVIAMIRLKVPASSPKMQAAIAKMLLHLAMALDIDADEWACTKRSDEWDAQASGDTEVKKRPDISMYLVHWLVQALLVALHNVDADGKQYIPNDMLGDLAIVLNKKTAQASLFVYDEMCRQLAFHFAGDNAKFDVMQLSYALLVHFETSLDSRGDGRLFMEDCGISKPPLNMKLAESALSVIFSKQMDNGLWPQGRAIDPIGDTFRGDVGNSFVFSFDLLGSLLEIISKDHEELFRQYLPQVQAAGAAVVCPTICVGFESPCWSSRATPERLERMITAFMFQTSNKNNTFFSRRCTQLHRSLKWAEDNIVETVETGLCDIETRVSKGTYIRGWRSNHLRDGGGPVMWCTAQVFIALSRSRDLLTELLQNDILQEFGGTHGAERDGAPWKQLLDADLTLGGKQASLKESMDKHLINPLLNHESRDPLDKMTGLGLGGKDVSAKYSVILYGPPGTAKTTICTSVAKKLGWSFLTIDTADFLAEGLVHVASRMTYIFERLKSLQKCVILFDEVEEFCLDREDKSLSMESRMLTTAMLTQLNDLRRQQKCVFIVATNRLRSFDAAVTRPGRFDLIFLVGTPALNDRHGRLVKKLQSAGLDTATQPVFNPTEQKVHEKLASDLVKELMEENWQKDMMFLNFAENEIIMEDVMALIRERQLSRESFQAMLEQHMATCTIQGSVREEYLASMKMSRA